MPVGFGLQIPQIVVNTRKIVLSAYLALETSGNPEYSRLGPYNNYLAICNGPLRFPGKFRRPRLIADINLSRNRFYRKASLHDIRYDRRGTTLYRT